VDEETVVCPWLYPGTVDVVEMPFRLWENERPAGHTRREDGSWVTEDVPVYIHTLIDLRLRTERAWDCLRVYDIRVLVSART
jgi:hypothetical protein